MARRRRRRAAARSPRRPRLLEQGRRRPLEGGRVAAPAALESRIPADLQVRLHEARELELPRRRHDEQGLRQRIRSTTPTPPSCRPNRRPSARQVEANSIEVQRLQPAVSAGRTARRPNRRRKSWSTCCTKASPSPQLQAAIFNALAELPGIAIQTGATDGLGREGAAIVAGDRRRGPLGSDLRPDDRRRRSPPARCWSIRRPAAASRNCPAGTTVRREDLIEAGVVDSTEETGAAVGG